MRQAIGLLAMPAQAAGDWHLSRRPFEQLCASQRIHHKQGEQALRIRRQDLKNKAAGCWAVPLYGCGGVP